MVRRPPAPAASARSSSSTTVATTVTTAPDANNPSTLRRATPPPPTTRQRRPSSRRTTGYTSAHGRAGEQPLGDSAVADHLEGVGPQPPPERQQEVAGHSPQGRVALGVLGRHHQRPVLLLADQ